MEASKNPPSSKAKRIALPIRLKILVTLLVLTTTSIGTITFTMANLFHDDKIGYIRDLTSLIAQNTAHEAYTTLTSYKETLHSFARLMYDNTLTQSQKSALLKNMFEDYPDFVSVTLSERARGDVTVYDANQLAEANISQDELEKHRTSNPLPMEKISNGYTYVGNSTVNENLPTLTIATPLEFSPKNNPAIIYGVVRLDKLLKLSKRSSVYETFLIDTNRFPLSHGVSLPLSEHEKVDWIPDLSPLIEGFSSSTTLEYEYRSTPYIGGFAAVGIGQLIAAVQIPESAAFLTARDLLNNLLGVAFALLLGITLAGLIWSQRISKPIGVLANATEGIRQGNFDTHVKVSSRDEIGFLADSFNRMAEGLKQRDNALATAQKQLIQSEKMSVFGNLSAGIAHEVKNPLAGILGYAQLSLSSVNRDHEAHGYLEVIEKETKRCNSIIENLLTFARQQNREELKSIDINQVIEYSIATVHHQLMINKIDVDKQLSANLPPVLGNANQIQQVLINLMINAQQAIGKNSGNIRLSSSQFDDKFVEIQVSDDGPGMDEEVKTHIFEPFFTTKPAGKGTGLGMSVSYGIIQDHKGEISIISSQGNGATFVIKLPISTEVEKNDSISRLTLD